MGKKTSSYVMITWSASTAIVAVHKGWKSPSETGSIEITSPGIRMQLLLSAFSDMEERNCWCLLMSSDFGSCNRYRVLGLLTEISVPEKKSGRKVYPQFTLRVYIRFTKENSWTRYLYPNRFISIFSFLTITDRITRNCQAMAILLVERRLSQL